MSILSIFDWSSTAGSNTDIAGNGIQTSSNASLGSPAFQNLMAQVSAGLIARGSDIATASTLDFTGATTRALTHDLTGTTTVTAVTLTAGHWRICRAQGAFQLTASSTLVVNGSTSTNDTTNAGDLVVFFGYSSSTVRVWRIPGGGASQATTSAYGTVKLATNALTEAGSDTTTTVTPANLGAVLNAGTDNSGGATITMGDGGYFNLITSTTAITAFAFTNDAVGRTARIRFNTVRTLTYNATSLIIPGAANITTAVGDIMQIRSLGSGNFVVEWYTRAAGPAGTTLLASGTVSSAATLDIVLSGYSGYRGILFELSNFVPATNATGLYMRVSTDGGSTYNAGGTDYAYAVVQAAANATTSGEGSSGADHLDITADTLNTAANGGVSATIDLLDHTNSARYPSISFKAASWNGSSVSQVARLGSGRRVAAQATNAVRFLFSSGNIASGSYAVYGYV